MMRLILRLAGIKDYESCKSCETLRVQLAIANQEKKDLTDTLLNLIQPKIHQANPIEIPEFKRQANTFSRHKASLEKAHESQREVRERSPFIVPNKDNTVKNISDDSIKEMENRLGLADEDGNAQTKAN